MDRPDMDIFSRPNSLSENRYFDRPFSIAEVEAISVIKWPIGNDRWLKKHNRQG
jgi:hypothetical protein